MLKTIIIDSNDFEIAELVADESKPFANCIVNVFYDDEKNIEWSMNIHYIRFDGCINVSIDSADMHFCNYDGAKIFGDLIMCAQSWLKSLNVFDMSRCDEIPENLPAGYKFK